MQQTCSPQNATAGPGPRAGQVRLLATPAMHTQRVMDAIWSIQVQLADSRLSTEAHSLRDKGCGVAMTHRWQRDLRHSLRHSPNLTWNAKQAAGPG
jgi:hypothetical protein